MKMTVGREVSEGVLKNFAILTLIFNIVVPFIGLTALIVFMMIGRCENNQLFGMLCFVLAIYMSKWVLWESIHNINNALKNSLPRNIHDELDTQLATNKSTIVTIYFFLELMGFIMLLLTIVTQ